jgi:hypothetical protein
MTEEKELNLCKGLPLPEELWNFYSRNREKILQECISYQSYPNHRWRTHTIERYLNHQWLPIPWIGTQNKKSLPFGYEFNEEKAKELELDPNSVLFPIPEQLFALEEARRMVKHYTMSSVALWLSEETGRKISEGGLYQRLKNEQRRRERAHLEKEWAGRLSKALIAAAKIEEEFPGSKAPWARKRNYHNKANHGGRGRPTGKDKKLIHLFKLADPRKYIQAATGETEKPEKERKRRYPASLDDVSWDGPSRGDLSPT